MDKDKLMASELDTVKSSPQEGNQRWSGQRVPRWMERANKRADEAEVKVI